MAVLEQDVEEYLASMVSERGLSHLKAVPSLRRLTVHLHFAFIDERLEPDAALRRLEEALPDCEIVAADRLAATGGNQP